ncbi:somatostatin receptor type 5-like [Glandiceps talaboti]
MVLKDGDDDCNSTFDNEGLGVLPQWVFHGFIPTYYTVVCLGGLLGNGIVILVILNYPVMKVVPNIYILNLASADSLFLLGLPFLAYFNTTRKWIFGDLMCRLVLVIDGMNQFTGMFTLTAMSVDRYFAIVHSVWSKKYRTIKKARIVCLLMWLLSGMATIPFWIYARTQTFDDVTVCNVICSTSIQRMYIITTFIIGFGLPIVIISVCYVRIIAYLVIGSRRHRRIRIGRVAIMILLAVALFLLCWTPFWITQLMIVFVPPKSRTKALKIAYFCCPFLIYANSCLNPVVYTYVRQDFRQFITKIFRRSLSQKPSIQINGKNVNGSTCSRRQGGLHGVGSIQSLSASPRVSHCKLSEDPRSNTIEPTILPCVQVEMLPSGISKDN